MKFFVTRVTARRALAIEISTAVLTRRFEGSARWLDYEITEETLKKGRKVVRIEGRLLLSEQCIACIVSVQFYRERFDSHEWIPDYAIVRTHHALLGARYNVGERKGSKYPWVKAPLRAA